MFLRSAAAGELRDNGMVTLISPAITVAFVFSWVVELGVLTRSTVVGSWRLW
ncbi:MAG: hypothetical protein IPK33_13900 [Gemmatimonadetes bacterium]|nr:hypothetical protein [Gemmatimonadota bacterium]